MDGRSTNYLNLSVCAKHYSQSSQNWMLIPALVSNGTLWSIYNAINTLFRALKTPKIGWFGFWIAEPFGSLTWSFLSGMTLMGGATVGGCHCWLDAAATLRVECSGERSSCRYSKHGKSDNMEERSGDGSSLKEQTNQNRICLDPPFHDELVNPVWSFWLAGELESGGSLFISLFRIT